MRGFCPRTAIALAVVEYIGWFDHSRLHQTLGDIPPAEFRETRPDSDLDGGGSQHSLPLTSAGRDGPVRTD
jgi:hypothetical protein